MPVAEPLTNQVLDVIETRLSKLMLSDPDSYWTLVQQVVLPSREQWDGDQDAQPETPANNQVSVSIGDMVRNDAIDCPGNPPREGWDVEYRIRLRVMPSERDSIAVDRLCNRFVKDIRKALARDNAGEYRHDWTKLDYLAIDARWGDYERLISDGTSSSDGYVMPLVVTLRVNEGEM